VLHDLSFEVRPGEIFGFLGPNGAGKSTLFSVLTGLLPPAAGELRLDGRVVAFGARELRARMGVVFQEPSLDAKLTARENLLLGAALFALPRAAARERADRLLAAAGLADRAGDLAGRLSGGMRRRLELARALVHQPSILVLDEPTTGLDAAAFRRAWEALLALRQEEGLTLLLTTHRPDEAERCDRLAVLDRGRIVACETPEALRARVRGDVVVVEADEPGPLAAEIATRLGLDARAGPSAVTIERERGHELVPRLVEAFPAGRFRSVSVRRPTLADAFLDVTGQALEEPGGTP
jgi:ABC-2 type transport system ATP-binding protein